MSEQLFWAEIYRALIIIVKAIARYRLGKTVAVLPMNSDRETLTTPPIYEG